MKAFVTSLLISAAILLVATQSASGKPKQECFDIPDEENSKETVLRKFPQYGIQIKIPKNNHSVLLKTGEILIVDKGTYKYLQCLQNNPHALGKGITGILISDGNKVAPKNKFIIELRYGYNRFIVYTQDYSYVALRLLPGGKTTDISIFGSYQGEQEDDLRLLREISTMIELIK